MLCAGAIQTWKVQLLKLERIEPML